LLDQLKKINDQHRQSLVIDYKGGINWIENSTPNDCGWYFFSFRTEKRQVDI